MRLLPEIGEEVIQAWVGTKAFERGYKYYEDEAILNPRKRGNALIAECQGSQPTPYRVEVHLGPGGIEWGMCTCPAGEGGHCKHAAALMLTWVYEPVLFSEVPELEAVLENRSKEELIALIQQMLARHPDLEQLLELSAMSQINAGETLSPEQIVQQVQRAFSAAGGEWGDNAAVAENLQPVLRLGDEFLEREDARNAATVFQTLMESLLTYEDSLYNDEEGDLRQILAGCEQGIQECLEDLEDHEMRLALLRSLFEFYLWDIHAGGLGYADETPMILAEQSTPEEKQQIAAWIEAALPESDDFSAQFRRRFLGSLWIELLGDTLSDEEYLRICRETGLTQDLVDRLLSLDRVEEAQAAAREENGYRLTAMADLFEKYGHPEIGLKLVRDCPNSETDIQLLSWLKEYAVRHNQPQEALRLAENLFWQNQTLENYQALLRAAGALGAGAEVRERVLRRLENAGNFSLLVEIYLEENELDLALAAMERVNPELWWDRMAHLRRRVAQAVEAPRPREAIRQYLLLAEQLIGHRDRGSYAEAARFLQQVRKLYYGLGESDTWDHLIAGLRQEYRRLPALQDELRRAGLFDV